MPVAKLLSGQDKNIQGSGIAISEAAGTITYKGNFSKAGSNCIHRLTKPATNGLIEGSADTDPGCCNSEPDNPAKIAIRHGNNTGSFLFQQLYPYCHIHTQYWQEWAIHCRVADKALRRFMAAIAASRFLSRRLYVYRPITTPFFDNDVSAGGALQAEKTVGAIKLPAAANVILPHPLLDIFCNIAFYVQVRKKELILAIRRNS